MRRDVSGEGTAAPSRRGRTVSGKRVVLVIVGLIAVWGIVLAVLVWRAAHAPHHARVRERATCSAVDPTAVRDRAA